MSANVEILLSTYNGATYLPEQLNSILGQDHKQWKLLVREDGSTDGTVKIIEEFALKYPDKINFVRDNLGNIGYNKSYMELMKRATSDYIMLCDQDDYWYANKISALLSSIQKEEKRNPGRALLAFADLQLTDDSLNVTESSFYKRMRYTSNKGQQVFFLRNYVPGCNTIFNKALLQQALKTENIIGYHDQWLIMVASVIGRLVQAPVPLMKYRVHAKNAIGIKSRESTLSGRLMRLTKESLKYGFNNKGYRQALYSKNFLQIENICSRFPDLASDEAKNFINIDKSGYVQRKINNIKKPYIIERSVIDRLTYITCF